MNGCQVMKILVKKVNLIDSTKLEKMFQNKQKIEVARCGKILFIISSCPLFDMHFRFQMMKDNFPKRFHMDKVQCVCPYSVTEKIDHLDSNLTNIFPFYSKCDCQISCRLKLLLPDILLTYNVIAGDSVYSQCHCQISSRLTVSLPDIL